MCDICGCGNQEHHHHQDNHHHDTHHADSHSRGTPVGQLHFGDNQAGVTIGGVETTRLLELQASLFENNDRYAQRVRNHFKEQRTLALNLLSSPGSGKTCLLEKTLLIMTKTSPCQVIEGDQQTANDAQRIAATSVPCIQINTGKGCHLDSHMILHALKELPDLSEGFLFIENVGNLVCPAGFDLGENGKIVILSVTESEDKPLKYPDAFHRAELIIISKTDLLPFVDFDIDQCIEYARQVNPNIEIIQLSAKTGQGMENWLEWLQKRQNAV